MMENDLNKNIVGWARETVKDVLPAAFDRLQIEHVERSPSPVASRDALKHFEARRQGLISKVSIKFPRHMVFVQKGVGKGTPMSRAGTTSRKAKDWFNGPMDKQVQELGDIVAEGQADMVVNGLVIR